MTRTAFALVFAGIAVVAMAEPAPPPAPPAVPAHLLPHNAPGAKIRFEEPIVDFGRIKSGETIQHTYAFTNAGDQVLEIIGVQPSCGCTAMGEWTKRVEPGQTGKISIQFNSLNFNGPVLKTVTVTSNDKAQPVTVLQFKGTVWKPVDISPSFAVLNVPPDAGTATATVKIVNNTEDPIAIVSGPDSSNKSFKAEIRTNIPNKEFQMEITTVPPLAPGNQQGQVTFRTSSSHLPTGIVSVWANIQPAMAIMPPRLTLPAAPLSTKVLPTVTIQNNSTNAIKLSDPAINLPGIDVTLQEIVPGRAFSVTLAFPPGFTLPAGQEVALTVKSDSKANPVIRVPVVQLARAVPPPTPPPSVAPQALPAPPQPAPQQTSTH